MKNIYYLLLCAIIFTSCDACRYTTHKFSVTFDQDVVVSKEDINANIGKAIRISREFDSGIAKHMNDYLFQYQEYEGYTVETAELNYFWLRLKGDYPPNFNFMESVQAECELNGTLYPMAVLTFPDADDDSFKLTEVGVFVTRPTHMSEFTVFMSFVPKEEVSQDVKLSWNFSIEYLVEVQ